MTQVRGVRGAISVSENTRGAVLDSSRRLLEEMAVSNGIEADSIASVFFSMTPDLDAAFPAEAARQMGWTHVPLFGCQEAAVPGSLPLCIRILIHWNTDLRQEDIHHVYVGDAARLRPDLVRRDAQ